MRKLRNDGFFDTIYLEGEIKIYLEFTDKVCILFERTRNGYLEQFKMDYDTNIVCCTGYKFHELKYFSIYFYENRSDIKDCARRYFNMDLR